MKNHRKMVVISLGGSLIVPENMDLKFLRNFKKVIKKNTKNYKFVIVCGGGSVARKYINALNEEGKSEYLQSLAGIAITRVNARFMSYFFGFDPEFGIPHDMKHVENLLKKHDIIFCGALRYAPNQTSDATACRLAAYLKSDFINLTNVKGLYDKNPLKYKNARFIPETTRENLEKIMKQIEQKPGMHGPVDHTAMQIIKKNKIKVFIVGNNANQLDNLLNNKPFIGTKID
ncbi:UMP kinase [Candidatus Woesearchaeota archaeon]|nr:UMP kinase [Candidatus Woesearchaeota archaeon]